MDNFGYYFFGAIIVIGLLHCFLDRIGDKRSIARVKEYLSHNQPEIASVERYAVYGFGNIMFSEKDREQMFSFSTDHGLDILVSIMESAGIRVKIVTHVL